MTNHPTTPPATPPSAQPAAPSLTDAQIARRLRLQPCPFCGGEPRPIPEDGIGCRTCGAEMWARNGSSAMERWNRRHTITEASR